MDAGSSSGGACGSRDEAQRWLEIAERLLGARDLVGSKRFAERALELDPLIDTGGDADRILAVADVLLAAQSRRVGCYPNWYAVLQLEPSVTRSTALRHFRRLSLLLQPPNPLPCADSAYGLVREAWAVLSDPARKARFDAELAPQLRSGDTPASSPHFWTRCPTCWLVHQYDRAHLGRTLYCPGCHGAFTAAEMATPPTIVPGTDMYYCSWGFFPLGPPSGAHRRFPPPSDPNGRPPTNGPDGNVDPLGSEDGGMKSKQASPRRSKRLMKVVVTKRVGRGGFKKSFQGVENVAPEMKVKRPVVIDINEDIAVYPEVVGDLKQEDEDMANFDIDIDVDNLPNISFFKEEEIEIQVQ